MSAEIGYQGKAVLVKETVYGTAVQGGADTAFPFISLQDGKNVEFIEDSNIRGSAFRKLPVQSTKRFTPGWTQDAFFAGSLPLLLGLLCGDDTTSIVQNAAVQTVGGDHLFVPQGSNVGYSATLARLLAGVSAVKEFPGFKPMRIELTVSIGGQLQFTVSGPAQNLINTGATNTTASIAAATYDDPYELIPYHAMTVWFDDEDGGAFSASEKIHVEQLRFAWERAYKTVAGAASQLIRESVPDNFVMTEFSFTRPFEESLQDETDYLTPTSKRCKVQFSGSLLTNGDAGQNNEINLFLPSLRIAQNPDDVGGPGAVTQALTFTPGETDTAPNDMNSQVVPHVIVRNEQSTAYV